jgi:hypothetical protein
MSFYYDTTTGRYPVYLGELQNTFGNDVNPNSPPAPFVKVEEVAPPSASFNQKVLPGLPVNENGTWKQTWQIVDLTPEELNAKTQSVAMRVRNKRNVILLDTDWTQSGDSPVADKEVWKTYRQELRDISSQQGFPINITWPTAPAGYDPENPSILTILGNGRRPPRF